MYGARFLNFSLNLLAILSWTSYLQNGNNNNDIYARVWIVNEPFVVDDVCVFETDFQASNS